MADNVRSVSIGQIVVSKSAADVLVAYGLGSCVAVSMYDPQRKVGGMLHALLPSAANKSTMPDNPAKFVDLGVPLLLDEVLKLGASRSGLIVRLCGGASMLTSPGFKNTLNIGDRNVATAHEVLKSMGFSIKAQDTGGNNGRTAKLYIATGEMTIRTMGQQERPL